MVNTYGLGMLTENQYQDYVAIQNANWTSFRGEFMQRFADRKKNIEAECGYPLTERLTITDYKKLDDRDPIAARINRLYPVACWQVSPEVYEDEDIEVTTQFEQALSNIGSELSNIGGLYSNNEGNPLWSYLERADILSGIGRYGVILLGIDDSPDLSKPLKLEDLKAKVSTRKEYNEKTKEEETITTVNFAPAAVKKPSRMGIDPEVDPNRETEIGEDTAVEAPPFKPKHNLLYMRVLDEQYAEIAALDNNPSSKRYCLPEYYNLTMLGHTSVGISPSGTTTDTNKTVRVHWTRVIHVADNLMTNEFLGVPRCQRHYDRLYDLHKLYGGSAEMYWQSSSPGIAFETHPQLGGDVKINEVEARAALERRRQGLQKDMMIPGMHANSLAPQVSDPSPQIERQIEAICIYERCPKRIFMGSERGELSSNQDARGWYGEVKKRTHRHVTPNILIQVTNRFIQIGLLPVPKQYSVYWPDIASLTDAEKADIGLKRMQALAAYLQGGVDAMLDPKNAYIMIGCNEMEAKQLVESKMDDLESDEGLDVHAREDELAEEEAARAAEEAERAFGEGQTKRDLDAELGHRGLDIKAKEVDLKAKMARTKPKGM